MSERNYRVVQCATAASMFGQIAPIIISYHSSRAAAERGKRRARCEYAIGGYIQHIVRRCGKKPVWVDTPPDLPMASQQTCMIAQPYQ